MLNSITALFGKRGFAAFAIVGTAALLSLGIAKRVHLMWWIARPVNEAPTLVCQLAPIVDDTRPTCRVGSLSLSLPKEFLTDISTTRMLGTGFVFRADARRITVGLPHARNRDLSYPVDDSLLQLTPTRLLEAAYRSSTSDFRWSMTPSEVRRLRWLLLYKRLMCAADVQVVETHYREDIEALLLVFRNGASLEWISTDGTAAGTLLFDEKDVLNLSWVRPVCSGLRFSGAVYPEDMDGAELTRLIEVGQK